jgi:hypothetical protein
VLRKEALGQKCKRHEDLLTVATDADLMIDGELVIGGMRATGETYRANRDAVRIIDPEIPASACSTAISVASS